MIPGQLQRLSKAGRAEHVTWCSAGFGFGMNGLCPGWQILKLEKLDSRPREVQRLLRPWNLRSAAAAAVESANAAWVIGSTHCDPKLANQVPMSRTSRKTTKGRKVPRLTWLVLRLWGAAVWGSSTFGSSTFQLGIRVAAYREQRYKHWHWALFIDSKVIQQHLGRYETPHLHGVYCF